jgi:transcriptional regulator with XRE-family HTH domain
MTPRVLRRRREQRALAQDALARQLGVTIRTISRWETGAVAIPMPMRKFLAVMLPATGGKGRASGRLGYAQAVPSVEWVEKQTGVAYATLKKHYAKWMPDGRRSELRRLAAAFDAGSADALMWTLKSRMWTLVTKKARKIRMRGGGLELAERDRNASDSAGSTVRKGRERARIDVPDINLASTTKSGRRRGR